jgi:hypothetical protein
MRLGDALIAMRSLMRFTVRSATHGLAVGRFATMRRFAAMRSIAMRRLG